ncbi:MAG: signal peptide peptidase SppA [Candidatus Aphodosoma sp.]|nr:signal peptide peptidase SppA [Candidatus Aphodosoma sp.]
MKQFFKMFFASLLALVVASLLSIWFFVSIITAMTTFASQSESTNKLDDVTVLEIKLSGSLSDRSNSDEFDELMNSLDKKSFSLTLENLRIALDKAAASSQVKCLYLKCGNLSASPAAIEEARQLIAKFKEETNLPIYAYADNYNVNTYWIATLADKIYLNNQGILDIHGCVASPMFYKRALDKLGVKMQVFKVGTFKSAVEPYILTEMSEANRLQLNRMVEGLWQSVEQDIVNTRNISATDLNKYANEGLFFADNNITVEMGLIDSLVYEQDVKEIIKNEFGKNADFVGVNYMSKVNVTSDFSANKIAVLYANGDIDGNSDSSMDSEEIVKELNKLAKNDKVKAVVLRVNSPGGSAYGSEQMWYAAQQLKSKKPLIVSMGAYAASGGYYMSCMADTIVAENTTLTGSIGIFGMMPDIQGLTDKLGLDVDIVKTHNYSDLGNIFRPMTQNEKNLMQNQVNRGYDLFVKRCADGRGIPENRIREIAEGRVWLGKDALNLGLVDVIGGLDEAVEIAAEKADLDVYAVSSYPKKKTLVEMFTGDFINNVSLKILKNKLGGDAELFNQYLYLKNMTGIQAIMPYQVEF